MHRNEVIKHIVKYLPRRRIRGTMSIAVLTSGNGAILQALFKYSQQFEAYYKIKSVVTNNPSSKVLENGLKMKLTPHLIDHRQFPDREEFEKCLARCLKEEGADLIVLAGFLRVFGPYFLKEFENRIINIHPSLLPKYRGLHAIRRSLENKDETSGCTIHLVDQGLDTGPILAQRYCPVYAAYDTVEDLKQRIQVVEISLLPTVINEIARVVIRRDELWPGY